MSGVVFCLGMVRHAQACPGRFITKLMEIGTCDVAPAIENYYGPVGVVCYRLMAAWAKERDLGRGVTQRTFV